MLTGQWTTRAPDERYDLVDVLDHALQGVETCTLYRRVAEQRGDHELAQFFREAQQEESWLAERAQELLNQCVDLASSEFLV